MCHCSTYDDLELGSLRFSLCLQLFNRIPKRRAVGEQGEEWLASRDAQGDESTSRDPCGVCRMYARAWTRFEMAICSQDADESEEIPFCYLDAAAFACCLPCYGCTIGSLQYTVRSYFGLNGTKRQDCSDGCCFPRATILRNEQEIMLRERASKVQEGKKNKPYACYDQMLYPATTKPEQYTVRGEQIQVIASENKAADTNVSIKATPAKVHSVQDDVHQPPKSNRRALHTLEDDFAAPAKAKRQEHILHDDVESATPAKPVPHELGATALRAGPL
ncbi:hypothetical protein V8C42DRAFT_167994 [Trichoderma barbatum]